MSHFIPYFWVGQKIAFFLHDTYLLIRMSSPIISCLIVHNHTITKEPPHAEAFQFRLRPVD